MEFIDLKKQYLQQKDSINKEIQSVLNDGRYINGPAVAELEESLANFVGAKYCLGVSSGTDALLIALMSLNIRPGDEVITTPFSFISTAEVIILLGATPIFVDIREDTFNLNPQLIESAITSNTKAIMPVSLYGQIADMNEINEIANRHNLPVIEDGAQSFGATYNGKYSGNLSTIGCTSFFPSKPLGCYGDGGACFTDNGDLFKVMQEIRVHGQERRYHHSRIGINGRLDTLQAAILKAKLPFFKKEIKKRQLIGDLYTKLIKEKCKKVRPPIITEKNKSVFGQYTILVDDREQVIDLLKQKGIPTSVHYPTPLHKQPAIKDIISIQKLNITETVCDKVMSLPMHPFLEENNVTQIVQELANATN